MCALCACLRVNEAFKTRQLSFGRVTPYDWVCTASSLDRDLGVAGGVGLSCGVCGSGTDYYVMGELGSGV